MVNTDFIFEFRAIILKDRNHMQNTFWCPNYKRFLHFSLGKKKSAEKMYIWKLIPYSRQMFMSQNLWFSDVLRSYRNGILNWSWSSFLKFFGMQSHLKCTGFTDWRATLMDSLSNLVNITQRHIQKSSKI